MRLTTALVAILVFGCGCGPQSSKQGEATQTLLRAEQDESTGTILVFRAEEQEPILTQNAAPDFRPFLHPIATPDGQSVFTEFSPGHHTHQTGLYWGFTRVNGRDYFHHPEGDYWQRVSATVVEANGPQVKWQTVYHLLGEDSTAILTETQTWSMRETDGQFLLELEWRGEAKTDITIGEYDYGGMFLRMPWREGMRGEVVNAARHRNQLAEGKRAMWLDVGMQLEGRDDLAHVAIFDHPDNGGFPQPWRVDGQLGVGPVRARLGDWTIAEGETEVIRHQLVLYTGELDDVALNNAWIKFADQGPMYATASLWGIAQQEGLDAEFLTPDRAAEMMTLLDGFEV
ncbi:MAG: PmoA family protein, partial [Bacteroidetes bacterium]|nr:PmoA family protein [Bacteroidota bacterium]